MYNLFGYSELIVDRSQKSSGAIVASLKEAVDYFTVNRKINGKIRIRNVDPEESLVLSHLDGHLEIVGEESQRAFGCQMATDFWTSSDENERLYFKDSNVTKFLRGLPPDTLYCFEDQEGYSFKVKAASFSNTYMDFEVQLPRINSKIFTMFILPPSRMTIGKIFIIDCKAEISIESLLYSELMLVGSTLTSRNCFVPKDGSVVHDTDRGTLVVHDPDRIR